MQGALMRLINALDQFVERSRHVSGRSVFLDRIPVERAG
jgi:hypothetical protein